MPAAVKEACFIVAKDIAKHRDVSFGLIGATEFGGIRARVAPLVETMLAPYARVEHTIGIA